MSFSLPLVLHIYSSTVRVCRAVNIMYVCVFAAPSAAGKKKLPKRKICSHSIRTYCCSLPVTHIYNVVGITRAPMSQQ